MTVYDRAWQTNASQSQYQHSRRNTTLWRRVSYSFLSRPYLALYYKFINFKEYSDGSHWYVMICNGSDENNDVHDVEYGKKVRKYHGLQSRGVSRDEEHVRILVQAKTRESQASLKTNDSESQIDEDNSNSDSDNGRDILQNSDRIASTRADMSHQHISKNLQTTKSGDESVFKNVHDELIVLILRKINNVYQAAKLTSTCPRLNDLLMHSSSTISNTSNTFSDNISKQSIGDVIWKDAVVNSLLYLGRKYVFMLQERIYNKSWRLMFMRHPRLRIDGLYVSRNTYVRPGITDLTNRKGHAHLMVYFRYYRFFGNGRFMYKTSPLKPFEVETQFYRDAQRWHQHQNQRNNKKDFGPHVDRGHASAEESVSSRMNPPSTLSTNEGDRDSFLFANNRHGSDRNDANSHRNNKGNNNVEKIHEGYFEMSCSKVITKIKYKYAYGSETIVRTNLVLRSTVPGSNNRLDIDSIESWNTADQFNERNFVLNDIDNNADEDNLDGEQDNIPTTRHSRGLSTYIFIPRQDLRCTPFNLPPSEMDFFVTG